jgi:hypothetical protein
MTSIKLWHEPADYDGAIAVAKVVHNSGIAPAHLKNPQAVFVAMAMGAELGLSPMASLRAVYVVNGKPTMSADSMVGLVRQRGQVTQWDYDQVTDEAVTLTAARAGGNPVTLTWTEGMAKKAGLLAKGGPWTNYRRSMLRHRVDTEMCRTLWPDIVQGLYDPDEVQPATPVVASAVDVSSLPVIQTGAVTQPDLPAEAHPPLESIDGLGATYADACRAQGIRSPAQLWRAMQDGTAPPRMRQLAKDALRSEFEPAPAEPAEPEMSLVEELAIRIVDRDPAVGIVDLVADALVTDGIMPEAQMAYAAFGQRLRDAGIAYTSATAEQCAEAWASIIEGKQCD